MTTPAAALFAFGFASPWMLAGLAAAAIPVLIHFLHKRKYRTTSWAAMRFLLEAARKHSRRLRLEQLLLLIVRTLLLLLLGLAMAQPYVESLGSYFQADVPQHRIILIDASYSMGYTQGEASRFQRAKEIGRKIVSGSRQGDALNLVRIGQAAPWAVIRRPAYQQSQVLEEIDQLERTDGRSDLPASLRAVEKLLQAAPEIKRKEVFLISDFQRSDWSTGPAAQQKEIRRRLEHIGEEAALRLIHLGRSPSPNLGISDFSAEGSLMTVGRPVSLQVTVHNDGPTARNDQLLELFVDGHLADSRRIDIPADGATQANFRATFSNGGDHQLEVRLPEDALAVDNRRWLALPVREEVNVLLVNGKASGQVMGRATSHLRLALAPESREQPWPGLVHPKTIGDGELSGVDLSRYDCVFLCNVALFTPGEAELLRSYAENGGAVVFTLGDQVQPENYNRHFDDGAKPLLPGRLGNIRGEVAEKSEGFGFDPAGFNHPIIEPFRGNPDAGLETTRTYRFFQATVAEQSETRVVLRYSSGDPAILEKPIGRGRSFLITTSVDRQWGSWVVWPSFPPLMNELVFYAVSSRREERRLLVGEPLIRPIPSRAIDLTAAVKRPDGAEQSLRAGGQSRIVYAETWDSGLYRLELAAPLNREELFAVNVDPEEGDPASVRREELRSQILAGVDFTHRTDWQTVPRTARAEVNQRGGLSRWLLWAVLALLLIESLMAWNFTYGFLLFYIVVAAALVGQLWMWQPMAAVVVLLAALAGLAAIIQVMRRPSSQQRLT